MCFVYSRKDVSRNFEVVSDKNCVGFRWTFKNDNNFKRFIFYNTMVNLNCAKYRIVN